jgi:hypothetical protein
MNSWHTHLMMTLFISTAFQPITLLYCGTSSNMWHSDGYRSHYKLWHVTRQKDSHQLLKNIEWCTKCWNIYFVPHNYKIRVRNCKTCSNSWKWLSCAAQHHCHSNAKMKGVSKHGKQGWFTVEPCGVLCEHEECYWNATTLPRAFRQQVVSS